MWGQLKTHRINCFLVVVVVALDNLRSRIIPDNMEVTREHFERDGYQLLRDITQRVKTAQFGKLLVLSFVPVVIVIVFAPLSLLPLCPHLANLACVVAIDLEFSGVQRGGNGHGRKKTLVDRYINVREGAEKYQVLQFGICLVHYEEETGAASRPCPSPPQIKREREKEIPGADTVSFF